MLGFYSWPDNHTVLGYKLVKYHDDWFGLHKAQFHVTNYGVPEGTRRQWKDLLAAAGYRQKISFKRLAGRANREGDYLIWSPKNSTPGQEFIITQPFLETFCAQADNFMELSWGAACPHCGEKRDTHCYLEDEWICYVCTNTWPF